jgi:hypothetical protein
MGAGTPVNRNTQEVAVATVHCRYEFHQRIFDPRLHLEADELDDGYVWLCLGEIGAEDAPGDRLEPYHNALPLVRCSCGYDPLPPLPDPQPDGCWHPAGHP